MKTTNNVRDGHADASLVGCGVHLADHFIKLRGLELSLVCEKCKFSVIKLAG